MNKLETAIQNRIRAELGMEEDLRLMRNNNGVAFFPGRAVRYGLGDGSADLVGILKPMGRWFCLEVKQPGEDADADQKRWAKLFRKFGAFVAVVHSPEEARAALERARKGASK